MDRGAIDHIAGFHTLFSSYSTSSSKDKALSQMVLYQLLQMVLLRGLHLMLPSLFFMLQNFLKTCYQPVVLMTYLVVYYFLSKSLRLSGTWNGEYDFHW